MQNNADRLLTTEDAIKDCSFHYKQYMNLSRRSQGHWKLEQHVIFVVYPRNNFKQCCKWLRGTMEALAKNIGNQVQKTIRIRGLTVAYLDVFHDTGSRES